jgi:hypothetical protein
MKGPIWLKVFLLLPLILFSDYLLMAIIGCTTCLFGLGDEFYCGPFCITGKIILALSAAFFGYLIYPDIKKLINSKRNGASAEKQKDF